MFGRRSKPARTAGTSGTSGTAGTPEPPGRPRTPPKVDVYRSAENGRWLIGSDELLVKWDVESGDEAELVIRDLLAERAPELLGQLEFDSYPEAFFASTADEATARALAELIRAR
jgi:hypothetical protein